MQKWGTSFLGVSRRQAAMWVEVVVVRSRRKLLRRGRAEGLRLAGAAEVEEVG
jgi:hypothetical protein